MKKSHIILALDPGMLNTGWAAIEPINGEYVITKFGSIKPAGVTAKVAYRDQVERFGKSTISLSYLCEEVAKLVEEIRPDYVVTEDVYLNPRLPTAFASLLCWICAVKMMLYNKFQLMLYRIPTKVAKQAIFGAGDASKENVMEAVRNRSDIIFKQPKQALNLTEHEADAIAVGVAMASNLQSL